VERTAPARILRGVERVVGQLIRQRDARVDRRERHPEILRAIPERHQRDEGGVERLVVACTQRRLGPQTEIGRACDGEGLAAGVGNHAVEVEDEELHEGRQSMTGAL